MTQTKFTSLLATPSARGGASSFPATRSSCAASTAGSAARSSARYSVASSLDWSSIREIHLNINHVLTIRDHYSRNLCHSCSILTLSSPWSSCALSRLAAFRQRKLLMSGVVFGDDDIDVDGVESNLRFLVVLAPSPMTMPFVSRNISGAETNPPRLSTYFRPTFLYSGNRIVT